MTRRASAARRLGTGALALGALALAAGPTGPALADDQSIGAPYSALDLLSPCQEADNDARWGEYAETECEQYVMGFVGALRLLDEAGAGTGICPPELNTADEVRWAYMRWVHQDYTARKVMPAEEALMAALKDGFPCE